MRKLIYVFLAAILAWGCNSNAANTSADEGKNKTIPVKVELIGQQSENIELYYSGLSQPVITVPLSFQLPGSVSQIYVYEGDEVHKGQLLAELDNSSYQSLYNAAMAMQRQAQDAYERLKTVYENGSLPEIKWEDVKSSLEQANSSAEIAKNNLENCKITSPINGVIGSRNIEVGSNVIMGISVMNVISIDEMFARISVPEDEINKIQKGQIATVLFPALGQKSHEGIVEKIGVVANSLSKTFEVQVRLKNDGQKIKSGMICNVTIPLPFDEKGLLVPIQSVMQDESGNNYVYVVEKQGMTAQQRRVETDGIINNQLNVVSGLNAGDLLVTEGQQKLQNNDLVSVN